MIILYSRISTEIIQKVVTQYRRLNDRMCNWIISAQLYEIISVKFRCLTCSVLNNKAFTFDLQFEIVFNIIIIIVFGYF